MATLTRFEDIEVWKKARVLSREIFALTRSKEFYCDFALRDQILRSSGSIMDNIAEGFEREGRNEFIQMLTYSKGSAGETRSQLYRALDRGYVGEDKFRTLRNDLITISVMSASFIKYLKSSPYKGHKFKDRV